MEQVRRESLPVIRVPNPFLECFSPYDVGAISPLIIEVYGGSGHGKSMLCMQVALGYQKQGWEVVYSITEKFREHTALMVAQNLGADHCIVVSPQHFFEHAEEVLSLRGRLFWVVDSLSSVGSPGTYAYLWSTYNQFASLIAKYRGSESALRDSPSIICIISQVREGATVPGTTIRTSRPAHSPSINHYLHAIFRIKQSPKQQGVVKITAEHHSLLFYDGLNDSGPSVAAYNGKFASKEVEWEIGRPVPPPVPDVYVSEGISVYEFQPTRRKSSGGRR